MDVLLRTELYTGCERRVARLPLVSGAPCAAMASRAGIHRSAAARRVVVRRSRRCDQTGEHSGGSFSAADRRVGILAGHLPDFLGFQSFTDHCRHMSQFFEAQKLVRCVQSARGAPRI